MTRSEALGAIDELRRDMVTLDLSNKHLKAIVTYLLRTDSNVNEIQWCATEMRLTDVLKEHKVRQIIMQLEL